MKPLCTIANFKLKMSRHRKELREAPQWWIPRSWPIWPTRTSVTDWEIALLVELLLLKNQLLVCSEI